MRFQSGKYEGKTYEEIVLKQPDYVQFMIGKFRDGKVGKELIRLVKAFNAKGFTKLCQGCQQQATKTSVYTGGCDPYFWCENCNPYDAGAVRGKLVEVKTYFEALSHIDTYAAGKRTWKRDLIKQIAEGKGLPKRVSESSALKFFS